MHEGVGFPAEKPFDLNGVVSESVEENAGSDSVRVG